MRDPTPTAAPTTDAEVIAVWAPWCGQCRAMKPGLDKVAAEFDGRVRLSRVNSDEAPAEAERLGVLGLPTLIARRGGVEAARHTGAINEAAIRQLFAQLAEGGEVRAPRASTADKVLRLGAGAVFLAVGLWPPVKLPALVIGGLLLAWGLLTLRRR